MKIYLTEFKQDNKLYAGSNLFAETEEEADTIAFELGLTIIGEIISVDFRPDYEQYSFGKEHLEEQNILH